MFDFEKMTVENEIGMRKEDNEELFANVYHQMFGHTYDKHNCNSNDLNMEND